jgi:hypothetical protein
MLLSTHSVDAAPTRTESLGDTDSLRTVSAARGVDTENAEASGAASWLVLITFDSVALLVLLLDSLLLLDDDACAENSAPTTTDQASSTSHKPGPRRALESAAIPDLGWLCVNGSLPSFRCKIILNMIKYKTVIYKCPDLARRAITHPNNMI